MQNLLKNKIIKSSIVSNFKTIIKWDRYSKIRQNESLKDLKFETSDFVRNFVSIKVISIFFQVNFHESSRCAFPANITSSCFFIYPTKPFEIVASFPVQQYHCY